MRLLLGIRVAAAALIGLVAACTATAPGGSPTAAPSSPTLQASFDVGGRNMHIFCVGPVDSGRPTVIFEAGLGGLSLEWNPVLHVLDGSVRACVYDRAGTGRGRQSDPAPIGRTTSDQVADLHALLTAAEVQPPYVLVGFSLGGWNAMVYNDTYPNEVAGAVMVDVRPPAVSQRWLMALPPESATESAAIKFTRYETTTFDIDPTLNDEGLLLGDSATEAIGTTGFGDKPLVVLAAAEISENFAEFEPALAAALEGIWWDLQDELVSSSSNGRLVKVDTPEHDIPYDRPDAVVDAIHELLGI